MDKILVKDGHMIVISMRQDDIAGFYAKERVTMDYAEGYETTVIGAQMSGADLKMLITARVATLMEEGWEIV